jgi:hypothetical protein
MASSIVAVRRREVLRGIAALCAAVALPAVARRAAAQVVAAEDLTVTASSPFVVGAGQPLSTLVFGTVTIEPGASMTFYSPVQMNCQTLVRQ